MYSESCLSIVECTIAKKLKYMRGLLARLGWIISRQISKPRTIKRSTSRCKISLPNPTPYHVGIVHLLDSSVRVMSSSVQVESSEPHALAREEQTPSISLVHHNSIETIPINLQFHNEARYRRRPHRLRLRLDHPQAL